MTASRLRADRNSPLFHAALVTSAIIAAGLLATTPAHAATGTAASMRSSMSSQDQQFVEKAGPGNMAEVKMGELAADKATTPAIKEFGRWMTSAHGGAYTQLKEIAASMHVQVSPDLTSMQQTQYSKLQGLSGTQFDQAYLQGQEKAHVKTIKLFEEEARLGHNPYLVTYAKNLSPALHNHLAEIEDLMKTNMAMNTK